MIDMFVYFTRAAEEQFGVLKPFDDQAINRDLVFTALGWSMMTALDCTEYKFMSGSGEKDWYDQHKDTTHRTRNGKIVPVNRRSNAKYLGGYRRGKYRIGHRTLQTNNSFKSMETNEPTLHWMMKDMRINASLPLQFKRPATLGNLHNDAEILKMFKEGYILPDTSTVVELTRLASSPDIIDKAERREASRLNFLAHLKLARYEGYTSTVLLTHPKVIHNFFISRGCDIKFLGDWVWLDGSPCQAMEIEHSDDNIKAFAWGPNPLPVIVREFMPGGLGGGEHYIMTLREDGNGKLIHGLEAPGIAWFEEQGFIPTPDLQHTFTSQARWMHRFQMQPNIRLAQKSRLQLATNEVILAY